MEYRRLGRSGLKLSALSYGSWVTFGYQVTDDAVAAVILPDREAMVTALAEVVANALEAAMNSLYLSFFTAAATFLLLSTGSTMTRGSSNSFSASASRL